MSADHTALIKALRGCGARFAFMFGSAAAGATHPGSDLDVAAWWGAEPPASWDVDLPTGVDLTVLDEAPLWLTGRIAMDGVLLFDDDPPTRVAWQADTRLVYLDEIEGIRARQREWAKVVGDG